MPRIARRFGVSTAAVSLYISKRLPHLSGRHKTPVGLCAICFRLRPLYWDHCHATGREREQLCQACNTGLGHFDSEPDRLRHAANYIERNRGVAPDTV